MDVGGEEPGKYDTAGVNHSGPEMRVLWVTAGPFALNGYGFGMSECMRAMMCSLPSATPFWRFGLASVSVSVSMIM